MPAPTNPNVAEMQRMVQSILAGTPVTPPTPTLSPEEESMRTQNRDNMLAELDGLIRQATELRSNLQATTARNLTEKKLEEFMQPLVDRVDRVFIQATPNIERAARAVHAGEVSEDEDEDEEVEDERF